MDALVVIAGFKKKKDKMLLLMCRKSLPRLSNLPYDTNVQIILGGMTLTTIEWPPQLYSCGGDKEV